MITTEECEARIRNDKDEFIKALNDNDLIGWLVSSIGPLDNDALELGERVKDYVRVSVEAYAENMAREMNAESEPDAAHESRLIDRDNAADINRMNGSY